MNKNTVCKVIKNSGSWRVGEYLIFKKYKVPNEFGDCAIKWCGTRYGVEQSWHDGQCFSDILEPTDLTPEEALFITKL